MTEAEQTVLLTNFELPFNRSGSLKAVTFIGGLELLRLTLRERKRFTMIDLDKKSATRLARDLLEWADKQEE